MPAQIHPTAIVSSNAVLADDVIVGPFAVIDGPAILGRGCVVRASAHIIGRVTLGEGNDIGSGCVIGERPQHRGYNGEDTAVVIGNDNIFREHVTIHRGMPDATGVTRIGSHNYFMASSHVAHDCVVGDHTTFANSAMIAGHVTVEDRVFLSGNSAVHQHCRVGKLALLSGVSAASQDIPPFWMIRGVNIVVGVNVIGMRRSGIPTAEIQAVRAAFKLLYHERRPVTDAVARMEKQYSHIAAVMDVVQFIRASKRGVPGAHQYRMDQDVAAA
jgi:UDP-N-acetylglucosamine acyltransferase